MEHLCGRRLAKDGCKSSSCVFEKETYTDSSWNGGNFYVKFQLTSSTFLKGVFKGLDLSMESLE